MQHAACAVAIRMQHAAAGLWRYSQVREMNSFSCMATSVAIDPCEKGCFVNQYAAADAAHDLVKAVGALEEDQVTQSSDGRPCVVLVPVGQGDESGVRRAGCERIGWCQNLTVVSWRGAGSGGGLASLQQTCIAAWLGLGLVSSRTRKNKSHCAIPSQWWTLITLVGVGLSSTMCRTANGFIASAYLVHGGQFSEIRSRGSNHVEYRHCLTILVVSISPCGWTKILSFMAVTTFAVWLLARWL